MTCFPDQHAAAAWDIQSAAHGYIGSSDTSFDYNWASKRALARGCSARLAEEVSIRSTFVRKLKFRLTVNYGRASQSTFRLLPLREISWRSLSGMVSGGKLRHNV